MIAPRTPLGRAELSRSTRALLLILRVYVLVAVPLVAFAFLQALRP